MVTQIIQDANRHIHPSTKAKKAVSEVYATLNKESVNGKAKKEPADKPSSRISDKERRIKSIFLAIV